MNEYSWSEAYFAAVMETDWKKMQARVQVAREKIDERLCVLSEDHGGTPEERQDLWKALHGLHALRHDAAEWQGRQSEGPPPNSPSV